MTDPFFQLFHSNILKCFFMFLCLFGDFSLFYLFCIVFFVNRFSPPFFAMPKRQASSLHPSEANDWATKLGSALLAVSSDCQAARAGDGAG